ncbi:MAG: hypothetical protein WC526_04515 [Patescibacteria group bacterium]
MAKETGEGVQPLNLLFTKEGSEINLMYLEGIMTLRQTRQYLVDNRLGGNPILLVKFYDNWFTSLLRSFLVGSDASDDFHDVLVETYSAAFLDREEYSLETEILAKIIDGLRSSKRFAAAYGDLMSGIRKCARRKARKMTEPQRRFGEGK